MNRRDALLSIGSALSVAMAGCNDLTSTGGDDGTQQETGDGTAGDGTNGTPGGDDGTADGSEREIDYSTPQSVVTAHMLARADGDLQGMLATVHQDAPIRPALEETNETELQEQTANFSLTVDNTTVVEQNETDAVVEVTTTATFSGQENTETATFELRTEGDRWKLWQGVPDETNVEPADVDVGDDPETVYRRYFEAQSNGNLEVLLGVCHTEGPTYAEFSQWSVAEYNEAASAQNFTVQETTVLEENEDVAVVDGTVIWEPEPAEEGNTLEVQLELRTEDGEWRVWDAPEE